MRQAREGLRLAQEARPGIDALGELAAKDLERSGAVELGIVGRVDNPGTADAEYAVHDEPRDDGSGCEYLVACDASTARSFGAAISIRDAIGMRRARALGSIAGRMAHTYLGILSAVHCKLVITRARARALARARSRTQL
jgi:hypothetical protein